MKNGIQNERKKWRTKPGKIKKNDREEKKEKPENQTTDRNDKAKERREVRIEQGQKKRWQVRNKD